MAVPRLRFKEFKGNWDSRKFSDILSFLGTNSFSRDKMNNISGSVKNVHYGDILVRYGNVLDVSVEQIPFINEDVSICKIKEKDYLLSGDVIIADTAEDYTVGKATEIINTQGIKIVAGLHTQACRPKRKFAIGYIGNFINSLAFRHQLRRIVQGTKVLSVIKSYLTDMEIHFPVEKEQQKITDFLTTFDKRIAAQQNIIADLEETKKGLLQKIFSQEIRFKDDNGQEFPSWKVQHVSDVCDINPKSDNAIEEKFYYIDIGSVDMGVVSLQTPIQSFNAPSRAQRILKEGDVLFQTVRPYQMGHYYFNKCNDFQTVASTGYAQLRCKGSNEALFIYQLLYTDNFNKDVRLRCTGTSYPAINSSDLAAINIKVPVGAEQQKIAAFLSIFDKKIAAEKQILSDLQEIKRGLLQQMFV